MKIITALPLALAAPTALLGGSYATYRKTFYNGPPRREDPYDIPTGGQYRDCREQAIALIRAFEALPYERVRIRAFDGVTLHARYYHLRDGAPLQIQMHGYRSSGLRDFSGGNRLAIELGHNRLLVEQRAHGESEARSICFGVKERLDCQAWAEYAAARFGRETPIALVGLSMGASTVLMAAELELPENVRCIVADCPFSAPREIIETVVRSSRPQLRPLLPLMGPGARLFAHFDLDGASAVGAVKRTKLPILLIHGEDDRYVPCEMSRQIAAACASSVRLETFPGAGHGLSYLKDPVRYHRIVREFLEENGVPCGG